MKGLIECAQDQKVVATSRNAEKLPKWDQGRDDNLLKVYYIRSGLSSIESLIRVVHRYQWM